VPSVILAELYRGPRHNHLVDACLSRETGLQVHDTDRPLAKIVGGVLASARAGSRMELNNIPAQGVPHSLSAPISFLVEQGPTLE
jgi:hypothetical protein